MTNSTPLKVAVIGCGSLGTALTAGLLSPLSTTHHVERLIATVASRESQQRVQNDLNNITTTANFEVLSSQENVQAIQASNVIILAFKPVKRESVFAVPGFKEAIRGKLIISIMAGITTSEIKRLAGGEDPALQVVRVMPNMAATIREAMSLCTADTATLTEENLRIAMWVFEQVGRVQFVPESTFDISAVLVGCAGSLLLLAIDGLLDAAVAEGIKRPEAQKFVVDSAIGMLKLVPAGNHPSVLREKIASPGGCSIRALLELEKRGVRSAYTDAIMVAAEKSRGMSKS